MQSSTSLPYAYPWPCITTTFFHMYTLLKYAAKAPRRICWHTTALSKAGVGWKPTHSSDGGQAIQESFISDRPSSLLWSVDMWAVPSPNNDEEVPIRLKISILVSDEKHSCCSRKYSAQLSIWLTPIASFDKKKRKEAPWSNSQRRPCHKNANSHGLSAAEN